MRNIRWRYLLWSDDFCNIIFLTFAPPNISCKTEDLCAHRFDINKIHYPITLPPRKRIDEQYYAPRFFGYGGFGAYVIVGLKLLIIRHLVVVLIDEGVIIRNTYIVIQIQPQDFYHTTNPSFMQNSIFHIQFMISLSSKSSSVIYIINTYPCHI